MLKLDILRTDQHFLWKLYTGSNGLQKKYAAHVFSLHMYIFLLFLLFLLISLNISLLFQIFLLFTFNFEQLYSDVKITGEKLN